MKKKLLHLSLGLLSLGSMAAMPATQRAQAAQATRTQSTPDYISGYTDGSDDARDAKCSFRGSEAGYNDWYYSWRSYAAYYRDEASRTGDAAAYEYWSGYYDGLQEGYNLPALCGGGGGGTGPFEPEPYNPN
ncbi:hypothetical protein [Hymenobacter fodinae]|uniref:Secreted protein n=1 Tax=Hymenobacter fodinae TaxID=2510796 RepID=A0A4Z0P0U3_9BACT|nr:hypothetical protein [Hymenobacter fodinae]TGE04775.1 hypothetical protein EU556_21580 [Hymenobacter fodinae]